MEGSGIMKSFGETIQDQLLFEGSGIMKSSGQKYKIAEFGILNLFILVLRFKAQHSTLKQGSTVSTQTKLKSFPEGYLDYFLGAHMILIAQQV